MNEKVDIEIFKRRLSVEIEGLTPFEINSLAQKVSDKMTEIAAQNKTIADSSKLAILTALHLAAELQKAQEAQDTDRRVVEHKLDGVTDLLRSALQVAGKTE